MNKLRRNAIILSLCLACGIAGYLYGHISQPVYKIALSEILNSTPESKLFNSSFSNNELISSYNSSDMFKLLSNSSWTNQRIIRKGSWKILLGNGAKIHLSYYGNFFWVEGTKGFFLVHSNHKADYQALLDKIHIKTVAWRIARNET